MALLPATGAAQQDGGPLVRSVELDMTINPASAGWVEQALEDAENDGAEIVIFRLDTPGGLDDSTRDIVKDILAAPMPVVVYVSPNGARAGSAGAYITEAADVAAMAPQTNIGSATPISLGGGEQDEVLGRKIRNDAAAYIRALAEGHGRNGDLAEQLVRDAVNVTATEAQRRNLVDIVAEDEQALVRELDGFRVQGPKAQTLETTGARIDSVGVPFKFAALELLVNPNTVFLLLTMGLILIGLELFNPGMILPGTLGRRVVDPGPVRIGPAPDQRGGAAADPARVRAVRRGGLRDQPRRPRCGWRGVTRVRWPAAVRHRQRGVRDLCPIGAFDRGDPGRVLRVADRQGGAGTARAGAHGHGGPDRRARRGALTPRAPRTRVRKRGAVASPVRASRGSRSATRWWSRKSTG